MDIDQGVAGPRGQEVLQLGQGTVVMVPAQHVDDLMVLLDGTQQLENRTWYTSMDLREKKTGIIVAPI